jgi:hypothetical protein
LTQRDETRDEISARLAQSRAEIRRLLEPPVNEVAGGSPSAREMGVFPRSRTMRMLLSGRGLGVIGAILGGALIARPALAWRLIQLLPTSGLARTFVRAIAARRAKPE